MPRKALPVLVDRSGSDSDECMFDQSSVGRRKNITRLRKTNSAMSGQRLTIARTIDLCLSFFALGLCFMMPTATIRGLQYRTSTTEEDIEFIYTARYGGYIVGAFVGGFLFNCYNRQFLLFMSLLATAIGILVTPFCGILATLMTCSAITGSTMGLLDTGGNVWLLDLWGRKSAPIMQMMHFCFGLGAVMALIVAQPFIGAYSELDFHQSISGNVHSIFSPVGTHLQNNRFHHSISRRAIDEKIQNITATNTTTSLMTTLNTTEVPKISTVAPTTTTKFVPKKPMFADSKKIQDKWERKLPSDLSNKLLAAKAAALNKTTTESTTATTPSTAAVPVNSTSHVTATTHAPVQSSTMKATSLSPQENEKARASPSTLTNSTKSALPSKTSSGNGHKLKGTDSQKLHSAEPKVQAKASKLNSSGITLPRDSNSTDVEITSPESLNSTKAPVVAESSSPSGPEPHSKEGSATTVMTSKLAKVPTLKPLVIPLPHKTKLDSTTESTSSTVPTAGTINAKNDSPTNTQRHHSIKKVLSDDDQEDSWLEQTRKKIQKSGRFEIAYGILAGYVFLVAIVFLLFLCMNPREAKSKQEEELNDVHQSSRMRLPLIVLMCSFFFLYLGLEVSVAETLRQLSQQTTQQILTGDQLVYSFWGSFAAARALSIFISMRYACRTMLVANMGLCLTASVILVCGAHLPYVLMTGIVILGAGMSSIIPTSFIWLERYIQVTNRLSAQLILSSAAGEMVLPVLISVFTSKSPIVLVYVILVVLILCSINLGALCYVTSLRGEKYLTKPDRSLYQLASLDDDLETWNNASRKNRFEDFQIKRTTSNTFFYDRLNNINS